MKFLRGILVVIYFCNPLSFAAEGDHDDHAHEEAEDVKPHDDHGKEEGKEHADKDDHGHGEEKHGEEEAPKNVGPKKGVVEYDERKGLKLSPEAEKTFEVATHELTGASPWAIPSSGVLSAGEEKSVYRVVNGFIKRVKIAVIKKDKRQAFISSVTLKAGDKIVTHGINFIRTAELDLTSGETGHSH